MSKINFKTAPSEMLLIEQIVDRLLPMAKRAQIIRDRGEWVMDITACHCNGTPLNLPKLLGFPDASFAHDVFGINRFIDRRTGKIEDHFLPRSSRGANDKI